MAEGADQEDKTEEPSQRRLDEAIKRGDVPKSQEISTFFILGALTLAMMMTASGSGRMLALDLRGFLENAHMVPDSGAGMLAAGRRALQAAGGALVLAAVLVLARLRPVPAVRDEAAVPA